MKQINILIRFSDQNVFLEQVGNLAADNSLIYKDEGEGFKAHLVNAFKFTSLTISSPLIAIVRLIRSVVFVFSKDFQRAGREFLGGLATPIIAGVCLAGSVLSFVAHALTWKHISFYAQMRYIQGNFEAWVNNINLKDPNLATYSHRVSNPTKCTEKIWTTAPCMQPLLENGESSQGGLLDVERMKRIFPTLKINGIAKENNQIVIQSEYTDKDTYYEACNGACEHGRISKTFCCCHRINATYDRILCCEIGHGNCSPMADSRNSCGVSFCTMCGCGVCCCYAKTSEGTLIHTGFIAA
jgi:hypothetical protein